MANEEHFNDQMTGKDAGIKGPRGGAVWSPF